MNILLFELDAETKTNIPMDQEIDNCCLFTSFIFMTDMLNLGHSGHD